MWLLQGDKPGLKIELVNELAQVKGDYWVKSMLHLCPSITKSPCQTKTLQVLLRLSSLNRHFGLRRLWLQQSTTCCSRRPRQRGGGWARANSWGLPPCCWTRWSKGPLSWLITCWRPTLCKRTPKIYVSTGLSFCFVQVLMSVVDLHCRFETVDIEPQHWSLLPDIVFSGPPKASSGTWYQNISIGSINSCGVRVHCYVCGSNTFNKLSPGSGSEVFKGQVKPWVINVPCSLKRSSLAFQSGLLQNSTLYQYYSTVSLWKSYVRKKHFNVVLLCAWVTQLGISLIFSSRKQINPARRSIMIFRKLDRSI